MEAAAHMLQDILLCVADKTAPKVLGSFLSAKKKMEIIMFKEIGGLFEEESYVLEIIC